MKKTPASSRSRDAPNKGKTFQVLKTWKVYNPCEKENAITVASRSFQTEDDFWRMREFLREVFLLNDRLERSWHVARLDYARWHTCLNCAGVSLNEVAYLWEEAETIWFDDVTRSAC